MIKHSKGQVIPSLNPAELERLGREGKKLRFASMARNTVLSYASDLRVFTRWCQAAGREPLPATEDTVSLYLTYLLELGRKVSTARRHATALQHAHRSADLASPVTPEVWNLLAGAGRLCCETPRQAATFGIRELRRICRVRPKSVEELRDRAVLLFGFASALRRSNLSKLDLSHLTWTSRGVCVRVGREKQHQTGEGREVAIPRGSNALTCPVGALERWLKVRGRDDGPLFNAIAAGQIAPRRRIAPRRIGEVVRAAVRSIGLESGRFSSHSLRASFITEALERGVGEVRVAAHSGHRSLQSLKKYFRRRDPFAGNACAMVGL